MIAIPTSLCLYLSICVYVYVYICVYVYIYKCVCLHLSMCIICLYMCVYVCIYLCLCLYLSVCMQTIVDIQGFRYRQSYTEIVTRSHSNTQHSLFYSLSLSNSLIVSISTFAHIYSQYSHAHTHTRAQLHARGQAGTNKPVSLKNRCNFMCPPFLGKATLPAYLPAIQFVSVSVYVSVCMCDL